MMYFYGCISHLELLYVQFKRHTCLYTVYLVEVFDDAELTKLAAELKKKCGCGGAVKDGIIEIQGDKRDLLKSMLEAKGMKVKLAGG